MSENPSKVKKQALASNVRPIFLAHHPSIDINLFLTSTNTFTDLFILSMYLPAHSYVYHMCAGGYEEGREGHQIPGTGVTSVAVSLHVGSGNQTQVLVSILNYRVIPPTPYFYFSVKDIHGPE